MLKLSSSVVILLLIFITLPIKAPAGVCSALLKSPFDLDKDLPTIKKVGDLILQNFPPSEYYYIGLGQSPTPIVAYLDAMGETHGEIKVDTLPLSNFRFHAWIDFLSFNPGYTSKLGPGDTKLLFRHLKLYLPNRRGLEKRRVLLLDYIETGRSLAGARSYINLFYKGEKSKKALALGLMNSQFRPSMALGIEDLPWISIEESSFVSSLAEELYKPYSKYGYFELHQPPENPGKRPTSPLYNYLVGEISKRLKELALSEQ